MGTLRFLGHGPPDSRKAPEAPLLREKVHYPWFWALHPSGTLENQWTSDCNGKQDGRSRLRPSSAVAKGSNLLGPWPFSSMKSRVGR